MTRSCRHCGAAFTPRRTGEEFCCRGCEYVSTLILESGFGRYYQLKGDKLATPVLSRPFEEHDLSWLAPAISEAEAKTAGSHLTLDCRLEGISCVGCVWLIDALFAKEPGAIRAMANPATGNLRLEWRRGECDVPTFCALLGRYGYAVFPGGVAPRSPLRELAVRLGLCGAFAMNAMAFTLPVYLGMRPDFEFAGLFQLIAFASASLAMLTGGMYFIGRAWRIARGGALHMDLPIALGLLAAYAGSIAGWALGQSRLIYFDFVATFVFLMLLGRFIQSAAVERNRSKLSRTSPLPREVKTRDGKLELSQLASGTEFSVEPGKALPVTSWLADGPAAFSLEWIRGEAEPVTFQAGARLPAGAILLDRTTAQVTAAEGWNDSLISRLTQGPDHDPGSPVLKRLLKYYLSSVIVLGVAVFAAWGLLAGQWVQGLQAMISVFVVSCPCALGVAIPFADEKAASHLAAAGAFVRRASVWPRLRRVRHVIFDKTGTLTLERPELDNPQAVNALPDNAALALARLCSGSLHPVCRVLLEALGARGQRLLQNEGRRDVSEEPGKGVTLTASEAVWFLGKGAQPAATELRRNDETIARFRFRDELRPACAAAIAALRKRGLTLHLLSGDAPEKVGHIATLLGLSAAQVAGGLSPVEKAARVKAIDRGDTFYLGDGANDSLAFDEASVTATPVVDRSLLEAKADLYALGSSLSWLPAAFAAADARARGVRRAFIFAFLYNLTVVGIAASGRMSPLFAAVVMPLSSAVSLLLAGSGAAHDRIAFSGPDRYAAGKVTPARLASRGKFRKSHRASAL